MTETKTEKSFVDRYLEITNSVVEESLQNAAQKLNTAFDGIINTKLAEIGEVVNSALGVKNKAVMLTPLAIRKALLEQAESGKKTINEETPVPEGNLKAQNPIDKMFNDFEADKK
jgi:hypothetical protein